MSRIPNNRCVDPPQQHTRQKAPCIHRSARICRIASLFVFGIVCAFPALRADDRPDVLLIIADDIGYSDIGCFGGEVRTPHLDRLASKGLRFSNFYSENMCNVSRACLLTSVYHKASLKSGALHPRCVTLPASLRAAGYQTLMSGKWHLAGTQNRFFPSDAGFDRFYGILGGAASFFAPATLTRDRQNIEHEYREDPDYYFTDAITENARQFVTAADTDRPLFLYLAYTAAHWPLHARENDIAAYRGRYASGWDQLRVERLRRMKQLGVVDAHTKLSPRHPDVPAWEDAPEQAWQQRRMEVYAAQITAMDRGIGQVLETLETTRGLENTLVIFVIDNGGCHVEYTTDRKGPYLPEKTRDGRPVKPGNIPGLLPGGEDTYQSYGYGWANASNTPFRLFKQFDHEGGIHTPMIVSWPAVIEQQGHVVKHVAHLIDLMPTILQAAETAPLTSTPAGPPLASDGLSLLPLFHGQTAPVHESLFFQHNMGAAIRHGRWKLVRTRNAAWELYDLVSDPNELENLAPQHPERVERLRALWENWQAQQKSRAQGR